MALRARALLVLVLGSVACGGSTSGGTDTDPKTVGGGGAIVPSGAFFAPAEPTGSVTVQLHPTEAAAPGVATVVTFGFPFPRGSVTAADLGRVRLLRDGAEIPAYVAALTPWRHAQDPAQDGASVRVARIQIRYTPAVAYPEAEPVTVEWGVTARSRDVSQLVPPRSAWHPVTSGSFEASDGVSEPDVYVVLPAAHLSKGLLRPMRMDPFGAEVETTRSDPATTLAQVAGWPGFRAQERLAVDNFHTIVNDDDPRVGSEGRNPYRTDYEAWLYDRASAIYALYFRSGSFRALREAVRNAEFYRTQLGTGGAGAGGFRLKPGGDDSKYSYGECLAYSHWLTGDEAVLPYFDWVVSAHGSPRRWSSSATFWTERNAGFDLLATTVAYEVTGSQQHRSDLLSQVADLVWHQDGAGAALPAGRVDGGLYHLGAQHGDGTADQFVASAWMSVLVTDAMVRAFAFTEDAAIAAFVRRQGTFYAAAAKTDAYHIYEAGPLAYPDYMTRFDGRSDERNGDEVEHALELAAAVGWSVFFGELTGQSTADSRALAASLYQSYVAGAQHWIRPAGPASGLAAFRVAPPRKYAWEHRPSGSLSWALGSTRSSARAGAR